MVRMYSSSPPPLEEDGEEEDDDDFGEFGGYYCSVSSSFTFPEYDTPSALDRSDDTDTSPPDLYNTFTQSVSQPGNDLAAEKEEKITKEQEAPCPESLECENDVAVDCEDGKVEASKVPHGPLSSDSQGELSVVSRTGKQSTSKLQGFKLGAKDEHSDNPAGHCLSNGPITLCTGKDSEVPTPTSSNSTESGIAFTDKASTAEGPNNSHPLLEEKHRITHREVFEAWETQTGEVVTVAQEVDSILADQDQGTKENTEKDETDEYTLSGLCGTSSTSFHKMHIQMGSEDLGEVIGSSLVAAAENNPMPKAQLMENVEEWDESSGSAVVKEPLTVPVCTDLEEDIEGVCLPVVDQAVHYAEPDQDVREAKRTGSSVESDEDFGDFRDATQGFPDVSQSESMSQEGFADFVTALSDCSSHDDFADTLKDLKEEDERAAEDKDHVDNNDEMTCSELPPSDSFADFSSAPFGGLAGEAAGESWATFGQHEECEVQQESWAAFDEEQQNSTAMAPSTDGLQTDNALVCWGNFSIALFYDPFFFLNLDKILKAFLFIFL